jgi:hypothetical protein
VPRARRRAAAAGLALLTLLSLLGSTMASTGTAHAASGSSGPLASPTSDDAMLNLLMENGIGYTTATTAESASLAAGSDSTLVIDEDETDLSANDISTLADAQWGRVVILGTESNLLAAFAPGVTAQGEISTGGTNTTVSPQCDQADASTAGSVLMPAGTEVYQLPTGSGTGSTASPGASSGSSPTPTSSPSATQSTASIAQDITGCYPAGSGSAPAMVSLHNTETGGDVILLGWTDFTEDQYLAQQGDAALALRLFGAHGTLVWLATSFTEDQNLNGCLGNACSGNGATGNPNATSSGNGGGASGGSGSGGSGQGGGAQPPTLASLVPHWIWWMLLQLAVAALALAYWRSRRLGRLVSENLPVKVREAETVEGHANLYRRASAHGRAAGLLRSAAARRIAPLLGLPAGPAGRTPATLVAPLAAHLGQPPEQVRDILAGAAPMTETELVQLTDQLDRLEQEVRSP